MKERINKIILNELDDKISIEPTQDLKNDLNFDSLDFFEIAIHLEVEFNIDFSDSEVAKLKTVQDIYDLIEVKTKKE